MGQVKRLETSDARQFQRRLDAPREPELRLVLEDVERERHWRGNFHGVVAAREGLRAVHLLVALVRRMNLAQIQQHEPLNIPSVQWSDN